MHRVILVPEYPGTADAWSEYLPSSIHVQAEEEFCGQLQADFCYVPHDRSDMAEHAYAAWSYSYDLKNGRLRRILFNGHRDLGLYDELRDALRAIELQAKPWLAAQPHQFGLHVAATGIGAYFDAEEKLLRPGLVPPFQSPML